MKKSAFRFFVLLLSTSYIVSCSGNDSVNLRDGSTPPTTGGDNGQTKPQPSPTPGTSPTPEKPGDGGDGTNPTPAPSATPTPVVDKVARIFCESQPIAGRSFNTLRADVYSNYTMPSITLYVNNNYVSAVKSAVPLQSNGEQAFIILRAQEDFASPWKIYKSNVNIVDGRGDLQLISNFEKPSRNAQFAYDHLKIENRVLAANQKRTAYVYPSDNGTYVWESTKGSKFSLPFSADSAYSPEFVGGDDYVRFDQLAGGGATLTQKFYNFDTKKSLSLPSAIDSKDSQLFGYINSQKNTIYWVEGRAEGTWKLRSVGIGSGAKSATLITLPGNPSSFVLPMVIMDSQGDTLVAYAEEDVNRASAQPSFKTAALHLVKASSKLGKVIGTQTAEYSDDLKAMARTSSDFNQGVLRGLFLEPISGKLYASNVPKGGLVSYDLKKNSWEFHAMFANVFGCLNPQWGLEVPRE